MLFDDYLPQYDFSERHALTIRASAARVLDCAARFQPQDDALVRLAIRLREWPGRVLGVARARTLALDDFTLLGRDGDRAIAFGLVGAFWQPNFGLLDVPSGDAFKAIERADVCKLVMGFVVEPLAGDGAQAASRVRLRTETRVFCPNAAMRRRFAPYWYLIRPVSGLIRHRMLAGIRRLAEAPPGI